MSPQDYLANYRISQATELLTMTDLSIESIALSCGYTDPLIFSKVFKIKKGQTPSRYRKEVLNLHKSKLQNNRNTLERL